MIPEESALYRRLGTAASVFNREIKKQIVEEGAVDTGRMRNVTIVKIQWNKTSENISLKIDSTYYYKFVDKGTRYIVPRDITINFLQRSKVLEQQLKIRQALADYLTAKASLPK